MMNGNNSSKDIPGWRIIRTIGKGSSGRVYEIEKEDGFGAVVHSALKVITIPETEAEIKAYRDDGYDDDSLTALFRSRVEDITAEFKLMSRLKGCSNIVSYEDHKIVQHDYDPGYDVLIRMELLTPLPEYVKQQNIRGETVGATVQKIGIDICTALELCAKHRIIHRDIKPQNVFVNDNGNYKLGDFGIAKTSDHTTRATKTGTYGYMAPEVYFGRPYNAQVDLYSLGLVMYWMLNERRGPFLPLPPTVPTPAQGADAMERRMSGEPLPPPKNGSIELKRIVLKACAYDPKDRYANPTELKRDLERLSVGAEEKTVNAGATVYGATDEKTTAVLFSRPLNVGRPTDPENGETMQTEKHSQRTRFVTEDRENTVDKASGKKKWMIAALSAAAALLTLSIIAVFVLRGINSSAQPDAHTTSNYRASTPTGKTAAGSVATPSSASNADHTTVSDTTQTKNSGTTSQEGSIPVSTPVSEPTVVFPDYITGGSIQLKTVSDDCFLGFGAEKTNPKGDKGYYISKTRNQQEAITFRVVQIDEYMVELQIPESNAVYYLDAFWPEREENAEGADIWKKGRESDQRWILEKQNDGTYLIYLEGYPNRFLTNKATKSGDALSVWKRTYDSTQDWNIVVVSDLQGTSGSVRTSDSHKTTESQKTPNSREKTDIWKAIDQSGVCRYINMTYESIRSQFGQLKSVDVTFDEWLHYLYRFSGNSAIEFSFDADLYEAEEKMDYSGPIPGSIAEQYVKGTDLCDGVVLNLSQLGFSGSVRASEINAEVFEFMPDSGLWIAHAEHNNLDFYFVCDDSRGTISSKNGCWIVRK